MTDPQHSRATTAECRLSSAKREDVDRRGPVPARDLRVTDGERETVAALLLRGHGRGLLTLDEVDARTAAAWQAVTRGQLDDVTADLPAEPAVPDEPLRPRPRRGLRDVTAVWLAISVCSLVIWALLCLTDLRLSYPWWIWAAVPPGSVLAVAWAFTSHNSDDH